MLFELSGMGLCVGVGGVVLCLQGPRTGCRGSPRLVICLYSTPPPDRRQGGAIDLLVRSEPIGRGAEPSSTRKKASLPS